MNPYTLITSLISGVAAHHPALARLLEAALYAVAGYAIGAVMTGEVFNLHAAAVAFLTPVAMAIEKRRRDAQREISDAAVRG